MLAIINNNYQLILRKTLDNDKNGSKYRQSFILTKSQPDHIEQYRPPTPTSLYFQTLYRGGDGGVRSLGTDLTLLNEREFIKNHGNCLFTP